MRNAFSYLFQIPQMSWDKQNQGETFYSITDKAKNERGIQVPVWPVTKGSDHSFQLKL